MVRTAVIDNDALVNFSNLHRVKPFFHHLQNLFHTVYFPAEVVGEFAKGEALEPHRGWILQRLKPEQGFFRFCTSYDSIVMAMLQGHRGIDKGEAEAYAQLKKVHADLIISDDVLFAKTLKVLDSTIRVYSSVHLICWLDMTGYIATWKDTVRLLHQSRPFASRYLRHAYLEIGGMLGLHISKKVIGQKCSLKRLLGTK